MYYQIDADLISRPIKYTYVFTHHATQNAYTVNDIHKL